MALRTSKFASKANEISVETNAKKIQVDPPAIVRTRPVSNATMTASLKKNLNPYSSGQAHALKSRKSLIQSSYGLRKPPIKQSPLVNVGSVSLGKQSSRMGQQQS